MSYEVKSPEAHRGARVGAGGSAVGRRTAPRLPFDRSGVRLRESDPLWRWLVAAASWCVVFVVEGFAAYGEAMYPGLYYPVEHGDGHASNGDRHGGTRAGTHDQLGALPPGSGRAGLREVVGVRRFSTAVVGGREPVARTKVTSVVSRGRSARSEARFVKLWLRWRGEVAARRKVASLSACDDRLLRDIGISRDQIRSFVRNGDLRE